MTQKFFIRTFGFAVALAVLTPLAAQAQTRFHGLDRNRDGVITRAEWRGNDQSFRQHDTNHDGVISGVEVRRVPSVRVDDDRNRDDRDRDDKNKPAKVKPNKPVKAKPAKPVKKGHGGGHKG